jgi:hypothetical protein
MGDTDRGREVPSWPVASAVIYEDGTATLTIHNTEYPIQAHSPHAARREIISIVARDLAAELRRPVRLGTLDPDGSQGLLAVHPDGAITELAVREPSVASSNAPRRARRSTARRSGRNRDARAAAVKEQVAVTNVLGKRQRAVIALAALVPAVVGVAILINRPSGEIPQTEAHASVQNVAATSIRPFLRDRADLTATRHAAKRRKDPAKTKRPPHRKTEMRRRPATVRSRTEPSAVSPTTPATFSRAPSGAIPASSPRLAGDRAEREFLGP